MQRRNIGINRKVLRLGTTTVLLLAACGATTLGAQAATAQIPPPPPVCNPFRTLGGNSSSVFAYNEEICAGPSGTTVTKYDVSVARLVNGTWVTVATGLGEALYKCVGTTSYEYTALGFTATYACG
jgi:hypothetical protein